MKTRIALLAVFSIMVLAFIGCSGSGTETPEDIGEWSITIVVGSDDPITFTNEDALELGPVDIEASQKDGETFLEPQTWRGILLYDLLDYLDVEDFSVIDVQSADDYAEQFRADYINEEVTGFGWKVEGDMLDEESGPIQFIAHQKGPKWWIKQVSKITIIENEQ